MRELDIRVSAASAIVIFLGIILYKGSVEFTEIGSAIASAISIVIFLRYLFIKWVWKWLPILEKVHGIPRLEGKWSGTYSSNYVCKESGLKKTGSVDVVITQPSLFSIKVTQDSPDSNSFSVTELLETKADGTVSLVYTYLVEPKAIVRDKHQISYGTSKYRFSRDNSHETLKGNYWTDQGSTGYIELEKP